MIAFPDDSVLIHAVLAWIGDVFLVQDIRYLMRA